MVIGKRETQEFVSRRENRKNLAKTLFDNDFVFLQGDPENYFGEPIWIGRIVPNMINDEFKKQSIWEADKRIKIDGIRLDRGDIGMTIQWYEQVTVIPGSDLVYEL